MEDLLALQGMGIANGMDQLLASGGGRPLGLPEVETSQRDQGQQGPGEEPFWPDQPEAEGHRQQEAAQPQMEVSPRPIEGRGDQTILDIPLSRLSRMEGQIGLVVLLSQMDEKTGLVVKTQRQGAVDKGTEKERGQYE